MRRNCCRDSGSNQPLVYKEQDCEVTLRPLHSILGYANPYTGG